MRLRSLLEYGHPAVRDLLKTFRSSVDTSGLELDLEPGLYNEPTVLISWVHNLRAPKGYATAVIKKLCQLADQFNITLELTYDWWKEDGPVNHNTGLGKLYQSLGFHVVDGGYDQGENIGFSMKREPHTIREAWNQELVDNITFNIIEDSEKEICPASSWVIDKIQALMNGKEIGYLKISHIPKKYLPKNIVDFAARFAPHPRIYDWDRREPVPNYKTWSKEQLLTALHKPRMPLWNKYETTRPEYIKLGTNWDQNKLLSLFETEGIKSLNRLYENEMKRLVSFHQYPFVDYIRVLDEYQGQGLGYMLYRKGVEFLAKRGQKLYASGIQTDKAQEFWDRAEKSNYVQKDKRGRYLKFESSLDEVRGYHGTNEPTIFAKSHVGNNSTVFGPYTSTRYGTFFSDNPDFAKQYGDHVREFELDLKAIVNGDHDLKELAYRFYTETDELGIDRDIALSARSVAYGDWQVWMLFEDELGEVFVPWLQSQGYDGASFSEYHDQDDSEIGGTTYVVFDPIDILPVNRDKQLDMFAVNEREGMLSPTQKNLKMAKNFLGTNITEDTSKITPEILTKVILQTRQEYLDQGQAKCLWDIGDGLCENFVHDVYKNLKPYGFNYQQDYQTLGELDSSDFWSDDFFMDIDRLRKLGEPIPLGIDEDELAMDLGGATHMWLTFKGKHYDAEAPEGVNRFLELPFFQRYIKKYMNTEDKVNINDYDRDNEYYLESDNKHMKVWHVTPSKNIPSIRKHGIVPQIGQNSQDWGETEHLVHVFYNRDNMEDAIANWPMASWGEEDEVPLTAIEITLPSDWVKNDPHYPKLIGLVDRTIPSKLFTKLHHDI